MRTAVGRVRWAVALCTVVAVVLGGGTAGAQSRGALAVLELRAPGGDDAAATGMTSALRAAARVAGFEVPATSVSLEQLVASLGCDDAVPVSCLARIATDLHLERFVYGTVRRTARGASTVRVELGLFERAGGVVGARHSFVLENAAAQSGAAQEPSRAAIDALVPPPAVAAVAPVVQAPPVVAPVVVAPPPAVAIAPSRPTPVLRYAGFATMGVGAVVAIVGAVFGIQWAVFNGQQQDPASEWARYQPPIADTTSSTAVCAYARTDMSAAGMRAAQTCDQNAFLLTGEAVLLTTGGVLVAAGLVMALLDRTGSAPVASAPSGRRREDGARVVGVVPVVTSTERGMALTVRF